MGVEDDRVARGQHVDRVAGERGQAVRDRRDRADDAERDVVGQRQAVVARVVVGAQVLDARHHGDGVLKLGDLVVEPADLGLFELEPPELLGLVDTDLADALDGLAAVGERPALERLERRLRRPSPRRPPSRRRRGCPTSRDGALPLVRDGPVPHLGQDLLDHVADQIFGHLHGWHRCVLKDGSVRIQRPDSADIGCRTSHVPAAPPCAEKITWPPTSTVSTSRSPRRRSAAFRFRA